MGGKKIILIVRNDTIPPRPCHGNFKHYVLSKVFITDLVLGNWGYIDPNNGSSTEQQLGYNGKI